ncbi:acyl-CoA carboxylase epsilon subunit [Streptomyces sp. NPDC054884]
MTADPLFTIRSGRPTEQEIAALTVALLTRLHRSAADPSAVADWAQRTPDVPVVAGLADWPGPDRPATTVWGRRSGGPDAGPAGSGWGEPAGADVPPETGWGSRPVPDQPPGGPEHRATAGRPALP